MAALLPLVLRPWRVVRGALCGARRGALCAAGLAVTASAGTANAAVHTATLHTAAVAHAATYSASAAKRRATKASKKAARLSTRAATRARSARHATKSSRATRHQAHERRHPVERSHADATPDVSAMALPVVTLPELALAPANPATLSTPGAGGNMLTVITRSASSLLDGLLVRARSQLGTRYVYGSANPGDALDCSSFARYVMEALNVRLPRTANQQAQIGRPVPRDPSQLRPGDLLTFGTRGHTSHVGIYLGEGRFIHASVKSGQVIETTIERNRSLFRRWQGARRLLAGTAGDTSSTARDLFSGG